MDITTKRDLEEVLKLEKDFYVEKSLSGYFEQLATSDLKLKIWDFQKHLRKAEYHYNNRKKSLYHKIMYIYHRRKKNVRGGVLGISIWENTFDEGLQIYYTSGTVINGTAKIGKYCKLHGNICIGNDGLSMEAPIIGDNVDIGVGAKIIGNVKVANNIIIGAGSIVVKDCDKEGVWAGVPSKFLH